MSREVLTEIELLKQADNNHDKTHDAIMERFKEMSKENKEEHKVLADAVGEIKSSIDTLPEKLDKRYASKEVEISVRRIGWMVISAVIVAMITLVLK